MSDIDKKIAECEGHTPRPWEIDRFKDKPPYLISNRHDVICLFQRHKRIKEKDIEANARLIALAPELLDQLKTCRGLLTQAHNWLIPLGKVHPGRPCYELGFIRQERLDEWMRKYHEQD